MKLEHIASVGNETLVIQLKQMQETQKEVLKQLKLSNHYNQEIIDDEIKEDEVEE